jgi:hypothetical protein
MSKVFFLLKDPTKKSIGLKIKKIKCGFSIIFFISDFQGYER